MPQERQRGPGDPLGLMGCRSFLDSVGDQLLLILPDYRIAMVNAAFLRSAGLPEEEVLGRRCHEVTHHSPAPCAMTGCACPLAAVAETGEVVTVAHEHFDGAGEKRHVDVVGSPVRDREGRVVAMIESVRDVTRQRQLEEALRQRNAELEDARRKREQFTSTVVHELKNILHGLGLHAQLLRPDVGDASARHAERIVDGSRRLARLVEDMRDAVAIESGRFTIAPARCDLGTMVQLAAEEPQLASEQHRIVVDLPDGSLEGTWDGWRLRQVLDNLISNAIKFSPPGSEVRIAAGRETERVSVSVTDAGVGIPAAKLSELFQPYARAHAHVRGVGLGLFVSRGIVEAHGGELSVQSEEGKGSTFRFWLPLADPAHSSPSPSPDDGG